MKRIGIAASKIAKDNIVLYNVYVVLISMLFSLFIFFVAGATVFIAFIFIGYITAEFKIYDFEKNRETIFALCLVSLALISAVFNILAIFKNIQFPSHKE